MKISPPDSLKSFVDEQVTRRRCDTRKEDVSEVLLKDIDLLRLRGILLKGAVSAPTMPADANYFGKLRERVKERARG